MLKYIFDFFIFVDFYQIDNLLIFAYIKNNNKQLVFICILDDYLGKILILNYFNKMRERKGRERERVINIDEYKLILKYFFDMRGERERRRERGWDKFLGIGSLNIFDDLLQKIFL